MSVVVRYTDLVESGKTLAHKMWGHVLLMAIRDGASSVHYHPWRSDEPLSYVIANVRHPLDPPPAEWCEWVVSAAWSVFAPRLSLLDRLIARWRGAACGGFTLWLEDCGVEWVGICWSSGKLIGADFFQVVPPVSGASGDAGARDGPPSDAEKTPS